MTRRLLARLVLLSCVLAAWIAPSGASAAKTPVCGTTDSDGNTVVGSLALDDNSSTTGTVRNRQG